MDFSIQMIALRSARYTLGWTQGDMSRHSGVSEVTIARFEAGNYLPKIKTILSLLVAVNDAGVELEIDSSTGGFRMNVSREAIAWRQSLRAS